MAKKKNVSGRRPKDWNNWTDKQKQAWINKILRRKPSEDATLAQLKRFENWLDSEIAKEDRKASFAQERADAKKAIEDKLSKIAGVPTKLRKRKK